MAGLGVEVCVWRGWGGGECGLPLRPDSMVPNVFRFN